jgi:hypothetical protein
MPGSAPRLISATSTFNGDSVILKFNKKMLAPTSGEFKISTELSNDIINSASLDKGDSTIFVFTLKEKVYYENSISISYSGTTAKSNDDGALPTFVNSPVTNLSAGYPPVIKSSILRKNGAYYRMIVLQFDKLLTSVDDPKNFFTITVNDQNITIVSANVLNDSIRFSTNTTIKNGDIIKISYSGGNLTGMRKGKVADFGNYLVTNNVPVALENLTLNNDVKLYPNPVKDLLNIKAPFEIDQLYIFDLSGKLMFWKKTEQLNNLSIPVNLTKGTYILKLQSNSSVSFSKFVVK